jgi:hypothetical protein
MHGDFKSLDGPEATPSLLSLASRVCAEVHIPLDSGALLLSHPRGLYDSCSRLPLGDLIFGAHRRVLGPDIPDRAVVVGSIPGLGGIGRIEWPPVQTTIFVVIAILVKTREIQARLQASLPPRVLNHVTRML